MMAAQKHGSSLLTTLIGIAALLIGAGGVFGQLQDSLNTIWEVKPNPRAGIWGFIRTRFLSFSMVLGMGFLLLVSMALTTFLTAVTSSLGRMLPISATLAQVLNFIVSFGVITLLCAMIFKYLPDIKISFRQVWVGALGTALLFTVGKHLLALYLGRESTISPYGAAGSVIAILIWVYYASVILFFGAEFTQVYARRTGPSIAPSQFAVPVRQEDRAQQGIPGGQSGPAAGREHSGSKPAIEHAPRTPGAVVYQRPWPFLGLMIAAGFAGATFLSLKSLRKAAKLYALLHRAKGPVSEI